MIRNLVDTTETLVKQEKNGLTEEEVQELTARGYEILHKLGEGQTREAYLARYSAGKVNKLRVLKIPKTAVSPDSICTLINKSKRDLDLAEVRVSNEVQHPNIVEVVDNFRLDGKTINAEAYYDGTDLETHVKTTGPLKDKQKVIKIFGQVVSALEYLNNERFILHRDIKPSNIIITRLGDVKISDLQNASKIRNIHEISMPTRGGTPYTHPKLLNALVSKNPARATRRTEVYAFGGTLLYTLTGKNPFDYAISSDPNGKPIEINGKIYRIKLTNEKTKLEEITRESHEKALKNTMKKVPKEWKNLIYRCLTLNPKKEIEEMSGTRKYIEKINSGFLGKLKENIVKTIRLSLPVLMASGIISLGLWSALSPKPETRPTIRDILRKSNYRNFSLETLTDSEKNYAYDLLVPYMKKAKDKLPKLENAKIYPEVKFGVGHSYDVHNMPKRLVSSWLRACYLNHKFHRQYDLVNDKRINPTFVPLNFVQVNDTLKHGAGLTKRSAVAFGSMYLKQCLGPEYNVADVLSNYFSTNQKINTARVKTKCIHYLPREGSEISMYPEIPVQMPVIRAGYGSALPYHQREIINTALALYLITDKEGEIDWGKIPELPFPKGNYNRRTMPKKY